MFSFMPQPSPRLADPVAALRARIAALERGGLAPAHGPHPFGHPALDGALPQGGLARGALHEAAGRGPEVEHGTAAALFIAGCMARLGGPILWAMERCDLFAPGLAMAGLPPDRLLYAEAGRAEAVLQVMEEGLREPALAGVVGEVTGRLSLSASRRLSLAAERGGGLAFLLRRSRRPDDPALEEPCSAHTRWRVAALPSAPPLRRVPGLARARWRLELMRARGAEPGEWDVEACDATGHLGVVADIIDRSAGAVPHGGPHGRAVAELEYEYEPEPEYAPALIPPAGRSKIRRRA
jgi:protein ImuA